MKKAKKTSAKKRVAKPKKRTVKKAAKSSKPKKTAKTKTAKAVKKPSVITFNAKITPSEYKVIETQARKYTKGNMSQFLRVATKAYRGPASVSSR